MPKLTPAMQQYADMKKQHPDCILFFRLGDFYEMFREDARLTSKLLDLTLTSKNKKADNPIPMAGIPHHSADKYIQKLIGLGYKVAVAEQTSTPQSGKLVEREIVSVVTPGNYIEESSNSTNFIMSITQLPTKNNSNFHCARGDFSLGKYYTKSFEKLEQLMKRITTLQVKELLIDPNFPAKDQIQNSCQQIQPCIITLYDVPTAPELLLTSILQTNTLDGYGNALTSGRRQAASMILSYLQETQKTALTNVNSMSLHHNKKVVFLDQTTIKNLELFVSSYDNNPHHALFGIINTTNTNMGGRLLKERLLTPSTDLQCIKHRNNMIEYYRTNKKTRKDIINLHKQIHDVPKIVATIIYRKCLPSHFLKLKNNLQTILHEQHEKELIHIDCQQDIIQKNQKLVEIIDTTLKQDIKDENINYIADGVDKNIDKLRQIAYHSDQLLLDYQQELVKTTEIQNIKIKYINNTGYVIEVTPKDIKQFEANSISGDNKFDFIRRQTLKSSQRYISSYLEQLQGEILNAKEQLVDKEKELLQNIKTNIEENSKSITTLCDKTALLDIYVSQAQISIDKNRCKPTCKTQGTTTIIEGRHPVIEELLPKEETFIPNKLDIGSDNKIDKSQEQGYIHIITGPNMGGKSTFLRQNALIVLMAQCGLYVPAKQATIKIVDGIFARVGSGDAIAQNQSTFMTEMIEVANILHNATNKSFVIFDEIGRGTATYDGLAISKAIIEHLHEQTKAQVLIATHYHELTQLEKRYNNIHNFSVSVYETDKEVVFLKKIVKGAANRSYGIEVAKIAGIPKSITSQAEVYLAQLEQEKKPHSPHALSLFAGSKNTIIPKHHQDRESILDQIDINQTTPLEALHIIQKLINAKNNNNKS